MMQKLDTDLIFVNNIVFSNEVSFLLNGNVNSHNSRYWANTNPHCMMKIHTQHPQKVNEWVEIVRQNVIGPFIIGGNLNGEIYYHML